MNYIEIALLGLLIISGIAASVSRNLMVSLIMWSITSVKVSAGRMQAANSVDQAMFSLFARFDRLFRVGRRDATAAVVNVEELQRSRADVGEGENG